jgi:ABC-type branched-subunit amino acid transport system ATPase component
MNPNFCERKSESSPCFILVISVPAISTTPSGSGKTTLLNVISTLDKATGGVVEIAGTDITRMKMKHLEVKVGVRYFHR